MLMRLCTWIDQTKPKLRAKVQRATKLGVPQAVVSLYQNKNTMRILNAIAILQLEAFQSRSAAESLEVNTIYIHYSSHY